LRWNTNAHEEKRGPWSMIVHVMTAALRVTERMNLLVWRMYDGTQRMVSRRIAVEP
jgi:hypothetical protein